MGKADIWLPLNSVHQWRGFILAWVSVLPLNSYASEMNLTCRFMIGSGGAESSVDHVVVDVQHNRMQFLSTSGGGAGWSYANDNDNTSIELRVGGTVVMTSIRAGVPSFSILNLTSGHLVWVHQRPEHPIVYNEFVCNPPQL